MQNRVANFEFDREEVELMLQSARVAAHYYEVKRALNGMMVGVDSSALDSLHDHQTIYEDLSMRLLVRLGTPPKLMVDDIKKDDAFQVHINNVWKDVIASEDAYYDEELKSMIVEFLFTSNKSTGFIDNKSEIRRMPNETRTKSGSATVQQGSEGPS